MTEKDFVASWIEKLQGGLLPQFPGDYIDGIACSEMALPGKNILLGEELFGSYELIDSEGNSVMVTDSHARAKYVLYSNRVYLNSVKIPEDEQKTADIVKTYEKKIDSLVKDIEKNFKKEFPESKNFLQASNTIFNKLNIKRY
ncbi:MAG: hypothetical protein ACM3Q2_05360 [Syntrophothermus sp.]